MGNSIWRLTPWTYVLSDKLAAILPFVLLPPQKGVMQSLGDEMKLC